MAGIVNTATLGTDFYCEDDIADDLAYESDPVRAYVQACFRRLVILTLFYADPYGVGIRRFLLDTSSGAIANDEIRSAITDSMMLDERTENCEVTFDAAGIHAHLTPRDVPSNTFTLSIDKVSGAITGVD